MGKIIKSELGQLLQVTDLNGNNRLDWRNEYVGDGMIVLFELEDEKLQFIRFYVNEPEVIFQRHLTTSAGVISEDDGFQWLFRTKNSLYNFGRVHCMSKLETEALTANVANELGMDWIKLGMD